MRRIVQAAFAILVPSVFFFSAIGLVGVGFSAQKQRRRLPANPRPASRPTNIDYSRFSHATKKHQGACNSCHKIPTNNWKKVRDYPDIADYPGHDACVSCHRPQFFKGAKPVICSICHTKVSPRDDVRFVFRNPAAPTQFLIEFPHDKHQDVIALLERPPYSAPVTQTVSLRRAWAHSRFVARETPQTNVLRYNILSARFADDKTKHYNNCEICHSPRTTPPSAPVTGWTDAFIPDAASFKDAPTLHAACFNCHWKSQQPTSENCGGCHKLAAKPYNLESVVNTPRRLSMKFRHAREQHVQECTTCHINITRASTLRGLLPDVPITSCSECHK